jgi:hypothetical protein
VQAGAVCGSSSCQNVAGSLAGLRRELPYTSASNGTSCATEIDGSVEAVLTTAPSGTTGKTYEVTLHFRGVVEQRTYTGYDADGAVGAEPEGGVNSGVLHRGRTDAVDRRHVQRVRTRHQRSAADLSLEQRDVRH